MAARRSDRGDGDDVTLNRRLFHPKTPFFVVMVFNQVFGSTDTSLS